MSGRRETRTSTSHCITCDQLSLHQTSSVKSSGWVFIFDPAMTSICCYLLSCVGSHNRLSNRHMAITKSKSVRLISVVLVAIVARWKKKKSSFFSGFDEIKNRNPAAVTKWRLHLLLWRNGTCSVDHVEIMQILLSPFLLSFLLSMFSFTAIASIALLEVWPTCNNFLRDLHNPNRLLHDWKLWSSAQFLLDHADFPLPRKSQSNPTTLKHILCILLHILQNPCNERPCVETNNKQAHWEVEAGHVR